MKWLQDDPRGAGETDGCVEFFRGVILKALNYFMTVTDGCKISFLRCDNVISGMKMGICWDTISDMFAIRPVYKKEEVIMSVRAG